ncbi:MAG: alcohol dehydrogenase [Myxococcales bacterium]|nr:alcohol dehydrogenase [Myxococcales bacterium]
MFTNSSKRHDFFRNAFTEHSKPPCQVLIAVAFFTDPEPVLDLVNRGCHVKLIVRLGFPTSPAALRKLLNIEGIQVRYINNESFHPKLYIFAEKCAFVGSSNLTKSALLTNQEINVGIPVSDPRYEDLVATFVDYWGQVRVLDESVLEKYERIFRKYEAAHRSLGQMDLEVAGLAKTQISNIGRDDIKQDAEDEFLDEYRTTYQGFLDAFRTVRRLYSETGKRKVPEDRLPLRLEVDSFLSWVREKLATGETYQHAPVLHGSDLNKKVLQAVDAWFNSSYRWFDEEVVPDRYPRIVRILGSEGAIKNASYDEILSALEVVNSFNDRRRFFRGGHETHVAAFRAENDLDAVKHTIRYLLFGKDDPIVRMGRCIFAPRYKLGQFGRSAVQELLGWINSDDIPVCNNRTLRSLRWMGFDVAVIGE